MHTTDAYAPTCDYCGDTGFVAVQKGSDRLLLVTDWYPSGSVRMRACTCRENNPVYLEQRRLSRLRASTRAQTRERIDRR